MLQVRGDCMPGVLVHGSRIEIRRSRRLLPGDVVVIPRDEALLVHRVIGGYVRRGVVKVLTQADSGKRPDRAVPVSAVLGRVVSVEGVALKIDLRSRLWALGRFLRFAVGKLLNP
jgi:phage repressor protein C with HTH and peptisase S24 domain